MVINEDGGLEGWMSKSLQHFDFNFPNCIGRHYLCHTHSAAFSLNWLLDNDDDSATTMMTMTMKLKLKLKMATGGRGRKTRLLTRLGGGT